jgi:metal-dependent amidase/aminoacylase/carboxypeptidase family protein
MDQLGIPYQKNVGGTGVVARFKSQKEEPVVAYRADMDALPLEESNDVVYKSQHPGVMLGLGCHDPAKGFQFPLHSPHFDMDERVLDVGVRLFGNVLVSYPEKVSSE